MRRSSHARLLPFLPAAAVVLLAGWAVVSEGPSAQTPPPGQPGAVAPKGPVVIDISGPRRDLFKIAVPRLLGDPDNGTVIAEVVSGDLYSSGWFRVLDPRSFLAHLEAEGLGIAVTDWRNIGAEGVTKGRATVWSDTLSVEFKLYEVGRGPYPVLEKSYKGPTSQARSFAHQWAAEVVKYFTNEDSFFNTKIAFSAANAGGKDIYTMDYDGHGVARITNNGSQNILPAWSPGGGQIAFTSFLKGNPDLYLYTFGQTGRPKRIAAYPGVNMGAAFAPDGGKIALTLSQDGNPEIYLINLEGKILKRLTDSPFIDSSPAYSPDGGRIAFVSNRYGSPQIWGMSAEGAGQKKLTTRGTYNQEPTWCPRCPTPTIAFTARDERSNFDIFTLAVDTGEMVRITENQGSNEHPTWAPTGRAMAFVSPSRGGIWVSTADGKLQRQVYRGGASTPTWGPMRK